MVGIVARTGYMVFSDKYKIWGWKCHILGEGKDKNWNFEHHIFSGCRCAAVCGKTASSAPFWPTKPRADSQKFWKHWQVKQKHTECVKLLWIMRQAYFSSRVRQESCPGCRFWYNACSSLIDWLAPDNITTLQYTRWPLSSAVHLRRGYRFKPTKRWQFFSPEQSPKHSNLHCTQTTERCRNVMCCESRKCIKMFALPCTVLPKHPS